MGSKTSKIILESFNKLIVENDFHKITVDMIMKAAEVSRATFYRHFKDKYDVMNANFKNLLDFYVSPQKSSNYRDLCYHLFEYGLEHLQVFKKAMESTGFNSFSNFIYEYSYRTALEITKQNRGGQGFTPVEELQADVFCNGICAVYKNMVNQRYKISASDAADALYEMMPESLKHYWWVTDPDLLQSEGL